MNRVESITYDTADGPVMLRMVDGRWIVSDSHGGNGFGSIVQAMAFIKAAYGWPLSLVSS